MPTPGAVPASMGKRLLAFVIDGVANLLLGGGFVAAGAIPVVQAALDEQATEVPAVAPIVYVGYGLLVLLGLFQWWYLATRGFTIGKRLVGLRVLSATTDRPLGLGRALLRFLVPALGAVACLVGQLLVYVSPFFDSSGRRQGWHDKAAGSVVLDIGVGVDPMTAGSGVGASEAARRLDTLLRQEGPRTASSTGSAPTGERPIAQVAAPPRPSPGLDPAARTVVRTPPPGETSTASTPLWPATSSSPPPEKPAPAAPRTPAAPPTPPAAAAPPTPPAAAGPARPAPSGPAQQAPAAPASQAPAPPGPAPLRAAGSSGLISSVPGTSPGAPRPEGPPEPSPAPRMTTPPTGTGGPGATGAPEEPADATGQVPLVRPGARPAATPTPSHPTPARADAPGASPDLASDVEMTRLRPARGKVPEVPHARGPRVVIELTDGRLVPVGGTALVGRNPAPRPDEDPDQLITIEDPARSVSKTHLAIGVDRGGVWIKDRDSTNGTVVTLDDGQQILCAAGQQVRLPDGASVALGDHGFTVRIEPEEG